MEYLYYHHESIDSTNSYVKQLPPPQAGSCYVVTADVQTAGRGRYERVWVSPPRKGLHLTMAFLPAPGVQPVAYAQRAQHCIDELLHQMGIDSAPKWPNDVMVHGKKIAGVLTEVHEGTVIVGIGLNVNLNEADIGAISQPATSMLLEAGRSFSVAEIRTRLMALFWAHGDLGMHLGA